MLLAQPEQFPRTVTEKLLVYALGRPLEHRDRPAIRAIVRNAAAGGYRWSSLILGIVRSPAFAGANAGVQSAQFRVQSSENPSRN
jgi:hypothetical protein